MRTAYLDCFAGISGDMLLGALIDAGVPREVLEAATSALQLGASLRFETVDRAGISAAKVHVLHGDRLADAPADPFADPFATEQGTARSSQPHVHPHPPAPTPDEPSSTDGHEVHGRSLAEIRDLLRTSTLADDVKTLALRTFDLLGTAEAKIHNVPVDTIHFH